MRTADRQLAALSTTLATILALSATASAQERLAPAALDAATLEGLVYATGAQASSHYGSGYEPTRAAGEPNYGALPT